MIKILAPRPTHMSAVATVLLVIKTSIVKYDKYTNTSITITERGRKRLTLY